METVANKVKRIVADTLGADENMITPDTDMMKDLGADSLDVVELIVNLEKAFNIAIPDEKAEHMRKVQHLIEYFEKTVPFPMALGNAA